MAKPGDYVVCLGAGSITQWAYALPARIGGGHGEREIGRACTQHRTRRRAASRSAMSPLRISACSARSLAERGYDVRYHDAGIERFDAESLLAPDLVIVLGGPIGVYESETYPFIADEVAAIERRLEADKPTLGICLGAQMMAAALGARVAPGPVKEIGWAPLTLTDAGRKSLLAPLGATPVLHWHGDNCELPAGCDTARLRRSIVRCRRFHRAPSQLALAVSSGDRAGAVRDLAGRPHRRARQGRHRSARLCARRREPVGRRRAKLGRKVLAAWLDHGGVR